jgi:hypothetical protein
MIKKKLKKKNKECKSVIECVNYMIKNENIKEN